MVHGLKQLAQSSTHVTRTSTLIDHILRSILSKVFQKSSINAGVSDH